ncbi:hypothetical protein GCM10027516_25010 [Niabella aquatica]
MYAGFHRYMPVFIDQCFQKFNMNRLYQEDIISYTHCIFAYKSTIYTIQTHKGKAGTAIQKL